MKNTEIERVAREKRRQKLLDNNGNPYPARVDRSHTCGQVLKDFKALSKKGVNVSVVGRIRSIRSHGGSMFIHVEDESAQLQLFVRKDILGEKQFTKLKNTADVGDFLEAVGKPYITKRGEKSILAEKSRIISKTLEPLPEKWHGLSDVEIRYRKRYLDLIVNYDVKEIFKKKCTMISALRSFLDKENFIEVETPVLHPIPGGAIARPFITHHNALDSDFYLRVAPELYLKRLIIGGYERVYEIARCFRNEGMDHSHNPEFTQVEFYAAYMDYKELMKLTERLLSHIVKKVNGSLQLTYQNNLIDFSPPYDRISFIDAINKYSKVSITSKTTENELKAILKRHNISVDKTWGRGEMLDEILKKLVRPNLLKPTFVHRYPIELSPLAKKTEDDDKYVERFQLFCGGKELTNAFSEINDPIDQEERFKNQDENRKKGSDEFHRIDADFLEALSHGMPPTAGFGMGLDRLANILTDTHSIKEVIFFPTLKPKT
ncbi:lysine--tRNA ligase [Patescibacteria group bacterium]